MCDTDLPIASPIVCAASAPEKTLPTGKQVRAPGMFGRIAKNLCSNIACIDQTMRLPAFGHVDGSRLDRLRLVGDILLQKAGGAQKDRWNIRCRDYFVS